MKKLEAVLCVAACLCVPAARASTIQSFDTPTGAHDGDGNVAAEVDFTISGTTLYITMINNIINPGAAGQLLSDLSFVLVNGSTPLTTGSLNGSISSVVGSSANVTVLDSNFNATTTTTKPATWQLGYGTSECVGGASHCYFLNDLTGGKPANMIIGPGPYTKANPSITGHDPSLAGPVVFEIDNITGLLSTTTVADVNLSFGTGPDGFSTLQTCTQDVNCGGGIQSITPEPVSVLLTGSGLLLLGMVRRKILPRG